jgi:serine/threonine-protein kinase RsbW
LNLILKNRPEERQRLDQSFREFGKRHGIPDRVLLAVSLALEELFTNIISYGYRDQAEHVVEAAFAVEDGKVRIELRDDGQPFDPTQHPPPNVNLSLDDKPIGGLGIHMARRSLDTIEYCREGEKNVLRMTKLLLGPVKSA